MGRKINGVTIKISENFFKNIFEPNRKELEKQLGIRVSQLKFTEFLAKKKIKFIPKKMSKKFFPKELR